MTKNARFINTGLLCLFGKAHFVVRQSSFWVIGAAVVAILPSPPALAQDSPARELIANYEQAIKNRRAARSGSSIPREELLAFGAQWRSNFIAALAEMKDDDPERARVAFEAALLAHQAGDHTAALALSDEVALCHARTNQPAQRALVVTNAAMIAWDAYCSKNTPENLARAMKRFSDAMPEIDILAEQNLTHCIEFFQKFASASRAGNDQLQAMLAYQKGMHLFDKHPEAATAMARRLGPHFTNFTRGWFEEKLQAVQEALTKSKAP